MSMGLMLGHQAIMDAPQNRFGLSPKIRKLDLDCVLTKLMDEHEDWSRARAEEAIEGYRYFLGLCHYYFVVDLRLVPARDIDEAWHSHILFTEKYDQDCNHIFGAKLHHFPYFGLQKDAAIKACVEHLRKMPSLYQQHFGFVPAAYDDIEQEIMDATTTKKLTSSKGWSGPMDLSK
jgi:hypothetical protein